MDIDNLEVNIDNLEDAISDILRGYGDLVYQATEEGLTAAEKALIKELKETSPKDSGDYAKRWRSKGRRFKLKRYVGNSKKVKGRTGEIPLSNIMEYSTNSPHQGLIKRTYQKAIPKMAQAVVDEIKKI